MGITATNPESRVERPRSLAISRWWMLVAGIVVFFLVTVWCLCSYFFGVAFKAARVQPVTAGMTWTAGPVQISLEQINQFTMKTWDDGYHKPVESDPNTTFVSVLLGYTLLDASATMSCRIGLMGDGRTWSSNTNLSASDIYPGAAGGCYSEDSEGNQVTSNTMGGVFQIPASALPEIKGIQVNVTVTDTSKEGTEFSSTITYTALMEGSVA